MKTPAIIGFFSLFLTALTSQTPLPPAKSVTVFKNGKSLVFRQGEVPTDKGVYATTILPNAWFGTFWASGKDVREVFTIQDSVWKQTDFTSNFDLLKKNKGKMVRLYLLDSNEKSPTVVEGTVEQFLQNDLQPGRMSGFLFKSTTGTYLTLNESSVKRIEFMEAPDLQRTAKLPESRLEVRFNNTKPKQELGLTYLTDQLGWAPIYRLDLSDKSSGALQLRAEISNDAGDLNEPELQLAVGIPNFTYATKSDILFSFIGWSQQMDDYDPTRFAFQNQMLSNATGYESRAAVGDVDDGARFAGDKAEDFFYYKIKPGPLPNHARYQYPIFENEVKTAHFYECSLPNAGPGALYQSRSKSFNHQEQDVLAVNHFIEMVNNGSFPWTTGPVNIFSKKDNAFQPISQDKLPYTPSGGTCKVKIAQTPEIKVTHTEGDVDHQPNVKKIFNDTYNLDKIEAQLCVVNYKSEPVTLKVRRSIEGMPKSSDIPWKTTQEQATLRVNPSFEVEWEVVLKPGEEKKWKYTYEVYVSF